MWRMAKGIDKATGRSHRRIDRSGTRNGRLVFIREVGINKHNHTVWLAKCDCGNLKKTSTPSRVKSCGCLQREIAAERAASRRVYTDDERMERKKAYAKIYRARLKECPAKQMQARLSRLHRHALAQVNAIKTSPTFEELGYTVDQFVAHIERQFVDGMSWSNMSEWQVDHIVPVASAKTRDDVIALNQLSNLRPMWSVENNRKGNKMEFLL